MGRSKSSPIVVLGVGGIIAYALLANPSRDAPAAPQSSSPAPVERQDAMPIGSTVKSPVSTVANAQARYEALYYAPMQAKVAWLCGFRSGEWYGRVKDDAYAFHLQLMERFSRAEREEMLAWQNRLAERFQHEVEPSGKPDAERCRGFDVVGIPARIDRIDWQAETIASK